MEYPFLKSNDDISNNDISNNSLQQENEEKKDIQENKKYTSCVKKLKKDYIALLNKSQPSQYESSFYHSPTWGD